MRGEFYCVRDVEWPGKVYSAVHDAQHAFNLVADISKDARMTAIAIDGHVFLLQGLRDNDADHTPVLRIFVWAICI
jgi:hypothetical protein